MCIIAHSPKGVNIPSYQYRKNMFDHNDDGAGFAYIKDGIVYWRKGLMTFAEFEEALGEISPEVLLNSDVVMHFRIGTHGGNTQQNTHPFPITNDYTEMQKLNGKSRQSLVFHNGIINSVDVPNKVSDTMAWIHDRLYYLYTYDKNCLKNPLIQDMITKDIGNSKLAICTRGGVQRIGSFIEENGCYYSNSTYSYPAYTSYNSYCYSGKSNYTSLPWKSNCTSVKVVYYRVKKDTKDLVYVETANDLYDVADVDQDIYVSFATSDKLVGDATTHVTEKIKLVDKDLKELDTTDLSKLKMIEWNNSISEYETKTYKVQCLKLDPEKDELWNLDEKKIYQIKTNNVILTEDDEVFIMSKDNLWKYENLIVATKDEMGVYRLTDYESLYIYRDCMEVDEYDLYYY